MFLRYHIGNITVLKRMTLSYFNSNHTIDIMSFLYILRAYYFIDYIYVNTPISIYIYAHISLNVVFYYFINSVSVSCIELINQTYILEFYSPS